METKSSIGRPAASVRTPTPPASRPTPPLILRHSPWLAAADDEVGTELPESVRRDLVWLQRATVSAGRATARLLVERVLQRIARADQPGPGDVNRRLRAARLWINAILAGDVSARTCGMVTDAWLPQLAASDDDPAAALRAVGRPAIEFLRGALSAVIFRRARANLVPHARALHALEVVLARHLAAIEAAVASR
ncbi:MAG: hypothetical protein IPM29_02765 [Planctomycetes bacterium]|nr:hypothetical protein [Planctomycetota bacterium]